MAVTPGPDRAEGRSSILRPTTGTAAPPALAPRTTVRRGAAALALIGVPAVLASFTPAFHGVGSDLPTAAFDISASFTRMLLAYLLSLGFAISFGYFAAQFRTGERVLIPILDILQSIPILGFFPLVIVLLVNATPGSFVGPNVATIFLIFTSMSWNMAFGVYESLKSVPAELREAADAFQVHGLQRLRQLLFPATVNRLVYNSVLSWTAGWYFLVAAEFISTSTGPPTALPGIGSYLLTAAYLHDGNALVAGLALLVGLIVALDVFVWRPLSRRAEKYRYDVTPSGEAELTGVPSGRRPLRRAAGFVARGLVTGVTRVGTPFVTLATWTVGGRHRKPRPLARSAGRYLLLGGVLVAAWLLLIYISVSVFHVFTGTITPIVRQQIDALPLAILFSFGRVIFAYALSLAIALPLALYLVRRPRVYKVGLPVVEVVASVPATALFPVFIFGLLPVLGFQGAAILMLMTGMLWYLFFNILSGLRGIPPDLEEAARSFGLSRREYYRKLVLPAIFPAFITGSITAFGGGWNTLVIAEYLQGPHQAFQVQGVGELIQIGNAEPMGYPLMAAALFTLVATVLVVNELLWKPMYRRAVDKYRYE